MPPPKDAPWIVVPNWFGEDDPETGLQHYRDRDPIWIKSYRRLLANDDYRELSGHRRAILHGLWLEYASTDGRLRLDSRSLSYRLALRVTTADVESLNHAGFITFSASKPLALSEQRASSEKRREEKEGSSKTPSSARAKANGKGAVFAIRTLIANGVITDLVDLDTELRHHQALTDDDLASLRAALPPTAVQPVSDEGADPTANDLRASLQDQARAAALAGTPWLDVEDQISARASQHPDAAELVSAAGDAYLAADRERAPA